MFIVKYKKIFIGLSIAMVVVSLISIFYFGLRSGIEFKGGALMEVVYPSGRPELSRIEDTIKEQDLGQALVQPTGETGYIIKTRDLSEAEHRALLGGISFDGAAVEEKSFTSIGPSVGSELKQKAIISITAVILAIILFITFAFRKVSRPVASWKYGVITVVTLLHDIIIPTGIFAALSHFNGAEMDTLFVLALLTTLGLSVHDKIVVFDRIRENLVLGGEKSAAKNFAEIVGMSTSQTFVRSVNITLTIILVLVPLYLFGPETTKNFSLVLTAGLFFGIYSSLFFASPLLVWVEDKQSKNK